MGKVGGYDIGYYGVDDFVFGVLYISLVFGFGFVLFFIVGVLFVDEEF